MHKTRLGTAAGWETKAWGFVPARTASTSTVHKVIKVTIEVTIRCSKVEKLEEKGLKKSGLPC